MLGRRLLGEFSSVREGARASSLTNKLNEFRDCGAILILVHRKCTSAGKDKYGIKNSL